METTRRQRRRSFDYILGSILSSFSFCCILVLSSSFAMSQFDRIIPSVPAGTERSTTVSVGWELTILCISISPYDTLLQKLPERGYYCKKIQVGNDQEKAQSKRFPLQKPKRENTKLTLRYLLYS